MSVELVRRAVEAKDLDALVATLAPEVTFHRPATMRPVQGREAVAELLGVLLEVFEDFRYVAQLSGAEEPGDPLSAGIGPLAVHGLVFRARVSGEDIEGIDMLSFDEQGRITSFVVMMRPLAGVLAIADAVGAKMVATASTVK
jgi:hypothetical protein